MAGNHIYSSSKFIQSGSVAQFKNGITTSDLTVEGAIYASNYFNLNGDEITDGGGGGSTAVFFAGDPFYISKSTADGVATPTSKDTFFPLTITNADPENSNLAAIGEVKIQTTSSGNFKPNYFNFLKIGTAVDDNIITVKQGEESFYEPTSEDERKGGINKYIIYAAETGSGGETHQIFHTVTIGSFVNVVPTILPENGTLFELNLDHDSSSKDFVLNFEESRDDNQVNNEGDDFLTSFTASRTNPQGTALDNSYDLYTLTLNHSDGGDSTDQDSHQSIAIESLEFPGFSSSEGAPRLHFTASVTNYNAVFSSTGINTIKLSQPQTETFKVTLRDQYPDNDENPGVSSHDNIQLKITPPPLTEISNIKVKFEGDNNTEGFTNKLVDTHDHTVLYDFTETLTSESIRQLDDRYTSSIVRIQVQADISPPVDINNDHYTYVQIQSGSTTTLANDDNTLGYFRINGNSSVATNINKSAIDPTGDYTSLEKEFDTSDFNRFTIVKELPVDGNGNALSISTEYYGVNTTLTELNNTTRVQHGTLKNGIINNHYDVYNAPAPNANLTINKCPNIKIENVVVEVESGNDHQQGYFSDDGTNQLTSSLLYGLSSSIISDEIPTLFSNLTAGQEPYNTYVSQSIVRLRLKCNIIEPFGPSHKDIVAQIKVDGGEGSSEEIITSYGPFSVDPTNVVSSNSNMLGHKSNKDTSEVGGTINLTNFFTSDGVTDLTTIDSISVIKIELRGDVDNGANENIQNFKCGGIFFGDDNYVSDTNSGILGDSSNFSTTPSTFRDAWVGTQPVNLNSDGTIDVSYNPGSGVNYNGGMSDSDNHYEIRITFSYETTTAVDTETPNPYTNTFETNATFTLNTSSEYQTDFGHTTNHGYGGSIFTGKELLTGSYTSSWVEFKTLPGTTTFSAHFTSGSTSDLGLATTVNVGTDAVDLTNSASVTMSVAPSTKIEDIIYEVETEGYSNLAATANTERTVLYGDAHFTNDGTGSGETGEEWGGVDENGTNIHILGVAMAQTSVSRFRFKARITEPIGIASSQPNVTLLLKPTNGDGNYSNDIFGFTNIPTTIGETDDDGNIFKSVSTLIDNQKVTVITSSWIGQQITLEGNDRNNNGSQQFTVSGTLGYAFDPNFEATAANELELIEDPTFRTITVNQTPATIIKRVEIQTETFGYSYDEDNDSNATDSSKRTVLYGDNVTTNDGTGSGETGYSWGRESSNDVIDVLSDVYASHSVSRFRFKAEIIEPLGHGHFDTKISSNINEFGTVNTNSAFLEDTTIVFPSLGRRSVYTSSFVGVPLLTTLGSDYTYNISPSAEHSPDGEISTTNITTTDNTVLIVKDTAPTEIKDVKVETETYGYSGAPDNTSTIIRTVLYGDNHLTNDGIEEGKSGFSWANHHLASVFRSQSVSRFRVNFKVIEPIGPLHHTTTFTKQFTHQDGTLTTPSAETFHTNSALIIDESHFDVDGTHVNSDKLIYTVTSSWIGQQLSSTDHSSGQTTTYAVPSANISHIAPNESPNTYAAINNSIAIKVFDTPPTQITNLEFETETEGLSGVGTNSTTRTVLYGDPHTTNTSTNAAWASHINVDTYNELSITRFRVKAKVIEPIGPLHHTTTFNKTLTSDNHSFSPSSININSESLGHAITTSVSTDNQLIIHYTTSFVGTSLTSNNQNGEVYTYTGTTTHNPTNENNHNAPAPIPSTITVNDTPNTIINITSVDIENKGESGILASNNPNSSTFPDTHIRTLMAGASLTSPTGSLISNDNFTGSAVLRTRIIATITEPIGHLHHGASMSVEYDGGSGTDYTGPEINFSTSSADYATPPPQSYNSDKKLVTEYTSLFTGSSISPQNHYELIVPEGNIQFAPSNENGFTRTETGRQPNFIKINPSGSPTITNFFIEVEQDNSGSQQGDRVYRNTFVLHGMTGSETSTLANELAPLTQRPATSKEQLVSVRILTTVNHPPSLDHHAINLSLKRYFSSSNLTFSPLTETVKTIKLTTGSSNSDVFSFNNPSILETTSGTQIHYTSSFFPLLFNARGNTKTGSTADINSAYSDAIFGESINNLGRLGITGSFIAGLITGTDASDLKHNKVIKTFIYGPQGSEDETISENEAFTRYSPTNAELRSHTAIPANFRDEDATSINNYNFRFHRYRNEEIEELKFEVGEGATYNNTDNSPYNKMSYYINSPQGPRPINTPRTPGGASLGEWTFQVQNTSWLTRQSSGRRFGSGIGTFDGLNTLWSTFDESLDSNLNIESTLADRTPILLEFGITQEEIDDIESNYKYTIPSNNSINALSEDHPLYILKTIPSYKRDQAGFNNGKDVYLITDPLIAFLLLHANKFTDPYTNETIYYVGYNDGEPGLVSEENVRMSNFADILFYPPIVGYDGRRKDGEAEYVNDISPNINSNFPWGKSYWDYGTGIDLRINFDDPDYKPIATASYGLFRGKNEALDSSFHFKRYVEPHANLNSMDWLSGLNVSAFYPPHRMTSGSINLSQSLKHPNNPRIKISNIKLQGDFNQTYQVTDNGNNHKNIQLYPYNSSVELFLGNKGALQLNEEISANKWGNADFHHSLVPHFQNNFQNSSLLKEENNYTSHLLDTEGKLLGTSIMIVPGKKPKNIDDENENNRKSDAATFYEAGHPVFNYSQQLLDLNVNDNIYFYKNISNAPEDSHVKIANGNYNNLSITDEYFNVQTSSIDYNSLIIPLNEGTMQFGFKRIPSDARRQADFFHKPYRKDIREDGTLASAGNNHSTSNKEYGYGMYSSNNENDSTLAKLHRQGQGEYSWGMKMSFEELALDLFYNEAMNDDGEIYRPFTMAVYGGGYLDDPENAINGISSNHGVFKAGREGDNFDGDVITPKITHDGIGYNLEIKIDIGDSEDSIVGDLIIKANKDYIKDAKLYASSTTQDPTFTGEGQMILSTDISTTIKTNETLEYNDGTFKLTEFEYAFSFNDWKNVGFNQVYKYYTLIIPLGTDETHIYDIDINTVDSQANLSNHERALYVVSASVDNITSNVNPSEIIFTPDTTIETENKINVFITGALSSSIESPFSLDNLLTSSFFNPNDSEESIYLIYPSGPTNGYISDYKEFQIFSSPNVISPTFTSESNLTFNENLNITFTSSNELFSFADDGSNPLNSDPANGTASIFISNPHNYSNIVTSSIITLKILDQETGSGFFQISKSIFVIPASPADMTGDFGSFTILGHPADKQDKFYTGSLVAGLGHYSQSIDVENPGVGGGRYLTSSRVIFTSQSDGSHDYRITLNTHVNPVYNGNYTTPNRAYAYGDTGSLEVILNGETQFIAYLGENFDKEYNNQDQNINGYNDDFSNGVINFSGGNGKLTLNKVSPFNGVSQSITSSEGIILSNGYQGWDATIEITSKPRDGYNYIELIHNITSSLTQSLNQFDWYYDDGHYTSSLENTGNYITMSNAPSHLEPTHSISGISYFKIDYPVSASINLIHHLASKTYPSTKNLMYSSRISSSLTIIGDGENMSGNDLFHRTYQLDDVTNLDFRRGLRFHENDVNWIPTEQSTGSVLYHIKQSSFGPPTGTDRDGGFIQGIKITARQKDPLSNDDYQDKYLGQKLIGRFMTSGSSISNYVAKTDSIETFFDEDRRWARTTMEEDNNTSHNYSSETYGYSYWLTASNANYNSNQSIVATEDLQQTYRGILKYPSKNYSVDGDNNLIYNNFHEFLPNYDLLTNNSNRFYYTALRLTDASVNSNTLNFKVRVYGNFATEDIFRSLFVGDALIDDSPIRVDIKFPGPSNSQGSGWSNIGYQNDNEDSLADGWNSYLSTSDNQLGGSVGSSYIEFRLNLIDRYIFFVNGVLLFRIRYKNTALGAGTLISNLEILPD